MDCIRLTFNEDRTYGWNVPVTLRSKKPMSVTITLKNGKQLKYDKVEEYQHCYAENWGGCIPNKACIALDNGEFILQPMSNIEFIHVTDAH
jgi:hypothetical protein